MSETGRIVDICWSSVAVDQLRSALRSLGNGVSVEQIASPGEPPELLVTVPEPVRMYASIHPGRHALDQVDVAVFDGRPCDDRSESHSTAEELEALILANCRTPTIAAASTPSAREEIGDPYLS